MRRTPAWAMLGLAILVGCGTGDAPEPADLVLTNGRIVTVDPDLPEAGALAARDGEIVAVGQDRDVERFVGPDTEVIDLAGRLAIPGFIEGHGHFTELGRTLRTVDLKGTRNWDEVVRRVETAAADTPPGQWISGRGWHQEKWSALPAETVGGYPVHALLSRTVPDHPVLLKHASGHAAIVNARALEAAGIGAGTPDPAGGAILRGRSGRPTGLLLENAVGLVVDARDARMAGLSAAEFDEIVREEIDLASRECLSKGVTSFQDAGADFETVERLRNAAEEGRLGVRLWIMLDEDNDALEQRGPNYRIRGVADEHLTVGGIKRLVDGALGTHGAWMVEPYADQPESTGDNVLPLHDLERTAAIALDQGFQLCVHAIGDRANREVLDLFERATAARINRDLRWRIEHAQHLSPDDIPRFRELGVIASMQPVHCTSDAPWVVKRLGENRAREGAYVWRSLLDAGAVISHGTDVPVEDVDPIANFYSAITRLPEGGPPFFPAQRMKRREALAAATIHAARAAFEEHRKGSLTPGKLADVVVLSDDILNAPRERIRDARVVMTIVGGEIRYKAPGRT